MEKDMMKLRAELYDKVVEMFGDEYKYIKIDVLLLKEKPKPDNGMTWTMDTDMIERSRDWYMLQGPNENNTGAIWDKSNQEKINS